jgi:hypothetical protein
MITYHLPLEKTRMPTVLRLEGYRFFFYFIAMSTYRDISILKKTIKQPNTMSHL